jgi:DNA polymerase-3 subunit epsilon
MTESRELKPRPRSNRLRRRMVVSLLGLALLPLVAALASQFLVVRDDVMENQKIQLIRESRQASEQLGGELRRYMQTAALLAAAPEVKAALSGSRPFPEGLYEAARKSQAGLQKIELMSTAPSPALPAISLSRESLVCRATVTDQREKPIGILELTLTLADLQNSLALHQKGERGGAVLFTTREQRLAGNQVIPLPPAVDSGNEGFTFFADGESYFAGVTVVKPPLNDAPWNLFLAMVLPTDQMHDQFNSVILQVVFLLSACAVLAVALAWRMANTFLTPILEIRRGAEIVSRINLSHRIVINTDDELEELASEFNHMAGNLAKVYGELEERVIEATRTALEEQNRLATVLRTMVDGVVVANDSAEIILMNPRARITLDRGFTSGIGAPLSRIFPGDRLNFHLKRLRLRWEQGLETVEDMIFPLRDGKLLKGSLSIVPGPGGELSGYLLVFRDLSDHSEQGSCFAETLREMPQHLRGAVATSRSLVETLQRHRDMPAERQQAFLAALADEMLRLSERVAAMEEATIAARTSRWPAIASNPRELFDEALLLTPGICIARDDNNAVIPLVQVEPFSWVASLSCVFQWIWMKKTGQESVEADLKVEEGAVVTTIRIKGAFDGSQTELESLEVCPAGEEPLTLGESVRRNRGELWIRSYPDSLEVRMALLQTAAVSEVFRSNGLVENEPEFYDFDLFLPRPVLEREDRLQTALPDLEYVVFDTETTGMRLSQGDRVVSISGVRIRRGRVQNSDTFHTLVNPGRPIPQESVEFHQIEDHMVAEAPFMNEVYPKFVEYVGDSVLVAHNAAFDMKCLQMAAAEAGLPLIDNPVLDTLMLSYALHTETEGHSLEAMAKRLGITIEGRHSSMGDARATAQIFLRLLLLLPGRGVKTLADAKGFCDQHLLLRWQSSRY